VRLSPFDRRLERRSQRPLAVAVSGGADSVLALRQTVAWAREHDRTVIALCVDHGLQEASAAWAAFAARAAEDLGAGACILQWQGPHPARGIPAAARAARHRLLAEAAREAGARVIVTGHTASDALENQALGQGLLSEWSPSPVWPEGRGLFFLRPLLDMSRGAVRARLAQTGGEWIDDPANENPLHARVRARRALVGSDLTVEDREDPEIATLARQAVFDLDHIALPRPAFAAAGPGAQRKVLGCAVVAAGGRQAIPPTTSLDRLCAALDKTGPVSASLAGARIAAGETIAIWRNAGEQARGGLAPLRLAGGQTGVWDGRYELTADRDIEVLAVKGLASRLSAADRRALARWPAAVRPGLPVLAPPNGTTSSPILASLDAAPARWLVPERFAAACGLIAQEGQL